MDHSSVANNENGTANSAPVMLHRTSRARTQVSRSFSLTEGCLELYENEHPRPHDIHQEGRKVK